MHFFAILLFMSFGVIALTAVSERAGGIAHVPWKRREARPVLAGGWGVGLAWLANFNMWSGWAIGHLRYAWVGVTLTGVALAGTALLAYAVFGFFAGLNRKFNDQAEQIEKSELRRVA
jgi:hypothetical protein